MDAERNDLQQEGNFEDFFNEAKRQNRPIKYLKSGQIEQTEGGYIKSTGIGFFEKDPELDNLLDLAFDINRYTLWRKGGYNLGSLLYEAKFELSDPNIPIEAGHIGIEYNVQIIDRKLQSGGYLGKVGTILSQNGKIVGKIVGKGVFTKI